ncbi:hypothetical protein Efla_005403 [Eimeria flavescens]
MEPRKTFRLSPAGYQRRTAGKNRLAQPRLIGVCIKQGARTRTDAAAVKQQQQHQQQQQQQQQKAAEEAGH